MSEEHKELLDQIQQTVEETAVKSITETLDEKVPAIVADAVTEESKKIKNTFIEEIKSLKDVGGLQEQREAESKTRCLAFLEESLKAYNGSNSCKLGEDGLKRLEEIGIDIEPITKAMNEGTATEGGNLVPPEFLAGIDFIAKSVGLTRILPAQFNTKSNSISYNVETATVTVAYTDELAVISDSTPTNARITLTVKKLAGIVIMSNELLMNADINVIEYLMRRFGEAIALKEDTEFLTGDGTNFLGVFEDTNFPVQTMASGDVDFTDITADYLRDMITAIPKSIRMGKSVGFLMSETVWANVQKLKDDEGQYLITQGAPQNAPVINGSNVVGSVSVNTPEGTVWNKYPVYTSEVLPENSDSAVSTKFIAFGNYERGYRFFKREDAEFAISKEATIGTTKLFQQDGTALRVITHHAMGRNLASAIVTLRTAAA